METRITVIGKIHFEPENKTKKHKNQASWKRIAMVNIKGDYTDYYAWFIKKRFNLVLNKPLRGAHISFINDSIVEIMKKNNLSQEEANKKWETVKKKWDGKEIPLMLNIDPRSDTKHWWLRLHETNVLDDIRTELGLGSPYWTYHMSIGYANEKNLEHSKYIHDLAKKGFI